VTFLSQPWNSPAPSDYVPPRNGVEARLAKIWGRTLGKYSISVKDNFFDLGGTSLLAIRLLAQIKSEFQEHLPFSTIFEAQTIEEMGNILTYRSLAATKPVGSPQIEIDLNGIHIWEADLNGFDSFRPICWLSEVEQERAFRFAHPKDQHRYRASHIILRQILSCYRSRSLEGVPFETNSFGKPALKETIAQPSLSFNMAHSESRAYFIIGNSRAVGIDSEFVLTDAFDDPTLCELVFHRRELETCPQFPIEKRKQYLLRLWTFKEAYIKLQGKSLAYHLQQVSTPPELPSLSCDKIHHLSHHAISYWHRSPSISCPYSITALAEGHVSSVRFFDFHEYRKTFPVCL
jgi:phosphopantetheinyl transferase